MSKNIIKKPVNKKVKLLKMIFSALGTTVSIQLATAVVLGAKSIKDLQDQNWKAEFNRILASNSVITKDLVKRYANRPEIDEIILPPNVKELGDNVFSNFKHVKKIMITKQTGLIGKDALKNMTSLEEVQIPDKSHIIGTQDLPDNIKIKYGNEEHTKATWKAKWNQENLTLEDSVISLSYNALKECDKIKTLDTNKVEQISANTLPNANLKELTLNDAIKQVIKKELFNPDFSIEKLNIGKALDVDELHNQLKQIKEIKHVKILETISKIDDNAFKDVNIKSIDLASTIKEIGKNAFENSKITEIDLKNTEIISEDAFNASQLKKVTFNSTLKSIKSKAFANCAFDDINFPDNIDEIADNAFSETSISNILTIGKLLEKSNIGKVISSFSMIANLTVKGNIEKIPAMSLANINVNTLTLENGIKELERKALHRATIKHLKFADTIEKIYKSNNQETDDDGTFSKVEQIDTIEIGKGLQNCSDLQELFFYGRNKTFNRFVNLKLTSTIDSLDENMWNSSIGSKTIYVEQILLDNKFTSLGNKTFKNVSFKKINLNNITDLGKQNFVSCDSSLDLDFSETMTKISDEAFMNTTCFNDGKTLNLKNVTEIGDKAFLNSSITKINLAKVTKIGANAFENSKLSGVLDLANVEEINNGAFRHCNDLKQTINGNISKIGNEAFYECSKLESVNLSNPELKEIGNEAFYNCGALKEINLESVEKFGISSFEKCAELTNINLKNATTIRKNAFLECTKLETIGEFEKEVEINEYAFTNDKNLKTFKLENVTKLGRNAFENCEKLELNNKFNDQITNIPESCFANCGNIKELDFNNIQTLDKNAFINAFNLKIKNSKKLRIIGEYALSNVAKNNKMDTFDTDNLEEIQNNGCQGLFVKKLNLKNIKKLGSEAFKESSIEEIIDLEKSNLKEIPQNAFSKCQQLEEINLSKIEKINDFAFYLCSKLTKIDLSNVKTLGVRSFLNASSIKKVNLSSLEQEELPEEVFGKCTNLEEVTLSSNVKTIGNNAFTACSNLTKINLENVQKIKTRAFYNNTSLSEIDLTSLERLEQEAFSNNRNLSKVTLGNLLKNIQKGSFKNSRSLKEINFNKVQTIEDEAFKDSGLRTLTMTNDLHRIGNNAFENVNFSDLDSLKFQTWTKINKHAFKNASFKENAEIDFNTRTVTIEEEAFYGIKNVQLIKNGSKVDKVGNRAFARSSLSNKGLTKENTFPNASEFGNDVFSA